MAAFGQARLGRLLLAQFIVALLAAGVVVWFLRQAWYPTISKAIAQMPAQGQIQHGRFDWNGPTPQMLAESRCLALAVDLKHEGFVRSPADIEVEFGRNDLRIFSLFGFHQVPYPAGHIVAFNQPELGPWWGAWAPPILAMAAAAVIVGLMAAWAALATLYSLPVWLLGFFANKNLDLRGSWRLSCAALMPGALLLIVAFVGYGLGILDLIKLLVAGGVHLVVGWVYLVLATLAAPRHPEVAAGAGNPFAGSGGDGA